MWTTLRGCGDYDLEEACAISGRIATTPPLIHGLNPLPARHRADEGYGAPARLRFIALASTLLEPNRICPVKLRMRRLQIRAQGQIA